MWNQLWGLLIPCSFGSICGKRYVIGIMSEKTRVKCIPLFYDLLCKVWSSRFNSPMPRLNFSSYIYTVVKMFEPLPPHHWKYDHLTAVSSVNKNLTRAPSISQPTDDARLLASPSKCWSGQRWRLLGLFFVWVRVGHARASNLTKEHHLITSEWKWLPHFYQI